MVRRTLIAALSIGLLASVATQAIATPILPSNSYYNDSIGTTLNGSPGFPVSGDPTVPPIAPEPPLNAAANAILGDWLSNPGALNSNWTEEAIPATWTVGTETAIIYKFMLPETSSFTALFGVDNGLYAWLDGAYAFGAMAPGSAVPGEYAADFGMLSAGTHYLQIIREDHGGATGWTATFDATSSATPVTPVPEPASLLLLGSGLAVAARRIRRRN
jgi:hypothetical protein